MRASRVASGILAALLCVSLATACGGGKGTVRVVIPPGAIHKLTNTGDGPLTLLCCCAPAYSNDDTVLTGG